MRYIREQAEKVIDQYQISDSVSLGKLMEICRGEGIVVMHYPLQGRIMERYIRTPDGISLLTIRSGVTQEADLKHYFAHGLGHTSFMAGITCTFISCGWTSRRLKLKPSHPFC